MSILTLRRLRRAAALTLVLLLTPLFSLAAGASAPASVPAGYNANDYNRLRAFLELTDENGVKNGVKCCDDYDPDDPATWGREGRYDEAGNYVDPTIFNWTDVNGVKRISEVVIFYDDAVGTLDLSGCTSLNALDVARNRITGLNLTGCSSLSTLVCSNNSIGSLSLSSCTGLMTLSCGHNSLTSLNLAPLTGLYSLSCEHNSLTSLNVASNTGLRYLEVSGNRIGSLNVAPLTSLLGLSCSDCDLSVLNVAPLTRLLALYCEGNRISSLNLAPLTQLQYLNVSGNSLSSLNLSSLTALLGLGCSDNQLTSLNVSACTSLTYLSCTGNRITSLDLSATRLGVDSVRAQGNGFVGVSIAVSNPGGEDMPELNNTVCAEPAQGSLFSGWFNNAGQLIGSQAELPVTGLADRVFIARFTAGAGLPGDADGNGTVNANDALLVLRYSLSVGSSIPDPGAADVDGNGVINANDALMILRCSLGLLQL